VLKLAKDITSEEDCKQLVEETVREFGSKDHSALKDDLQSKITSS